MSELQILRTTKFPPKPLASNLNNFSVPQYILWYNEINWNCGMNDFYLKELAKFFSPKRQPASPQNSFYAINYTLPSKLFNTWTKTTEEQKPNKHTLASFSPFLFDKTTKELYQFAQNNLFSTKPVQPISLIASRLFYKRNSEGKLKSRG